MIDDEITHEGLDEDLKPVDADNGSDDENQGGQSDGPNVRKKSPSDSENLPDNDDDWAAGLVESMNLTGDESETVLDPAEEDDSNSEEIDDHQEVTPENDDGNDDELDEVDDPEPEGDEDLTNNSDSLSDKEWKNLNSKTRSQMKGLRKRVREAETLSTQLQSDADFGKNINSMVSEVGATDAIFDSYMETFEELYTNPQVGIQKLENILAGARQAAGLPSADASDLPDNSVDPLLKDLAEEYYMELDDPRLQKLSAKLRHVGKDDNRQAPQMRREPEEPTRRNLRSQQNGEQGQAPQVLKDFSAKLKKDYPNEHATLEPEVATEMLIQAKRLKKLGARVDPEKMGVLADEALQAVLKRKKRSQPTSKKTPKPLRSGQRKATRRPRGDKQYAELGNLISDITEGRIR